MTGAIAHRPGGTGNPRMEQIMAFFTIKSRAHRAAGGDADPVAEDLLAEVRAEDAAGQLYSHKPGRA